LAQATDFYSGWYQNAYLVYRLSQFYLLTHLVVAMIKGSLMYLYLVTGVRGSKGRLGEPSARSALPVMAE
jgi:hypothetical protein